MAWPSVTSGNTQRVLASDYTAVVNALITWQGNVSANSFTLSNVSGISGSAFGSIAESGSSVLTITGGSAAVVGNVTLNVKTFGASGASHSSGVVPDPGASAGSTRFLREDSSWSAPPAAPVSSVFGRTGAVVAASGDYSFSLISGSATLGQLPSSVVAAITNDTNVQGSITAQTLTLAWAGTLAKARTLAATVYTDQANTFGAGNKQTTTSSASTAGLNLAGVSADPSSPAAGDHWYRSDLLQLSYYNGTATKRLATVDQIPAVPVTSVFTRTGAVIAAVGDYSFSQISGSATLGQLPSSVAAAITNDTNVTGSITAQTLTLGWTGALAKGRQNANTVYTDQANVFGAGNKQTTTSSVSTAGLNLAGVTADPSGLAAGDHWYRSDLTQLSYYNGTVAKRLATVDQIPAVPVTSVFGRTGAVVAAANDYSFSQISGAATVAQLPTGIPNANLLNSSVTVTAGAGLSGGGAVSLGGSISLAAVMGNLTEATSAVLTITGGTNAVMGSGTSVQVKQATTSQSGYLSNTDWNTFNGKQAALSVTNDTNVTGSVSGGVLTLGWTGTLAKARALGTVVYTDQANTYSAGLKQAFTPSTTTAGERSVGVAADPNTLVAGDYWFRSDTKHLRLYDGTATQTIMHASDTLPVSQITSGAALTEATSAVLTITGGSAALLAATSIQVKQATTSQSGYLSSTDWTTFNGKQNALTTGNLTEATSAVLTITGGTGAVIGSGASIQVKQASGAQNGYLSSTDWTTFNGKQSALTIGNFTEATSAVLTITGGTGAVIGSGLSVQVKLASGAQNGYLSSTDWTTFNSKQAAITFPLAIGSGGTGQITAAAGLTALGGASLTANNALTGTQAISSGVAGPLLTVTETGSGYASGNAAIRAYTQNATGTSNYFYDGSLNGTITYSVRADGYVSASAGGNFGGTIAGAALTLSGTAAFSGSATFTGSKTLIGTATDNGSGCNFQVLGAASFWQSSYGLYIATVQPTVVSGFYNWIQPGGGVLTFNSWNNVSAYVNVFSYTYTTFTVNVASYFGAGTWNGGYDNYYSSNTGNTWSEFRLGDSAGANAAADQLLLQVNARSLIGGADSWSNVLAIASQTGAVTVTPAVTYSGLQRINSTLGIGVTVPTSGLPPVFYAHVGTNLNAGIRYDSGSSSVAIYAANDANSAYAQLLLDGSSLAVNSMSAGTFTFSYPDKINFGSNYTNWTPTIAGSGSMTITSVTVNKAVYMRVGALVFFFLSFTGTLGGTLASAVTATLPVACFSQTDTFTQFCKLSNNGSQWGTGFADVGYPDTSHVNIYYPGAPNFAAGSFLCVINGFYRVT